MIAASAEENFTTPYNNRAINTWLQPLWGIISRPKSCLLTLNKVKEDPPRILSPSLRYCIYTHSPNVLEMLERCKMTSSVGINRSYSIGECKIPKNLTEREYPYGIPEVRLVFGE